MSDRIADALVVVLAGGVSLRGMRDGGLLEREWALFIRLAPQFQRIVVLSQAGSDDEGALSELAPAVQVISNRDQAPAATYLARIPMLVDAALRGCETVVVRTSQLSCSMAGIAAWSGARSGGRTASLVARGGYPWSRFVSHDSSPHSRIAIASGLEERSLCVAADVVVGTSSSMTSDLAWRYAIDPQRLRVVPNYVVDDTPMREVFDREPSTVLVAGMLTPRKRTDIVIRAIALLPDPLRSGVVLRIVGDGPEMPSLRSLARELHVNCDFVPRAAHRDLLDMMSRSTIFAQTSGLEGHPKTVLEAMSTGASVVVTDSPGLSDVVQNGVTGLRVLAEPGALSHAIGSLITDEDWRAILGTAASRTVRSDFSLDRIAPLEAESLRASLVMSRSRRPSDAATVGWDPALELVDGDQAGRAWASGLASFIDRLPADQRGSFVNELRRGVDAA